MRDLVIIGGGPAGISAGIYAARKQLDTSLLSEDFTGQLGLSSLIENYPGFKSISGLELTKIFLDHLKEYDIDIRSFEKVISIKELKDFYKIVTDEREYETKAVILCTGANPKRLGLKNEKKYLGRGISYCVTCDGIKYKDKTVVVVGGGNAGLEGALELSNYTKRVYVFEITDRLTADEVLIERVGKEKNIEVLVNVEVKSFEGEDRLKEIIYTDTKGERELLTDGCFIQIGCVPNTGFLNGFVKLNSRGEIVVDPKTFQTSKVGVYAAGDVVDFNEKQISLSVGQGALASLSAFRYVRGLE